MRVRIQDCETAKQESEGVMRKQLVRPFGDSSFFLPFAFFSFSSFPSPLPPFPSFPYTPSPSPTFPSGLLPARRLDSAGYQGAGGDGDQASDLI